MTFNKSLKREIIASVLAIILIKNFVEDYYQEHSFNDSIDKNLNQKVKIADQTPSLFSPPTNSFQNFHSTPIISNHPQHLLPHHINKIFF